MRQVGHRRKIERRRRVVHHSKAIQRFREFCDSIGSYAEIAELLDCDRTTICRWYISNRMIPAEMALLIDYVTNGKIKYTELRPDLDFNKNKRGKKR